jgi:hypothetical protein
MRPRGFEVEPVGRIGQHRRIMSRWLRALTHAPVILALMGSAPRPDTSSTHPHLLSSPPPGMARTGAMIRAMVIAEPRPGSRVWRKAIVEQVCSLATDPLGIPWPDSIAGQQHCERFAGTAWSITYPDYWLYRCVDRWGWGIRERFAFLLPDREQPTIEREQWTVGRAGGLQPSAIDSLGRELLDAFARRFPSDGLPFESGFAFRVADGWVRVEGHVDTLIVERRTRALEAARVGTDVPDEIGGPEDSVVVQHADEAARALDRQHAALTVALQHAPSRPGDVEVARHALVDAASERTPERADRLRYAVHVWLGHVAFADSDTLAIRAFNMSLAPFTIQVVRLPDAWCVSDTLAELLAARAGQNRWTDLAFVEVLDRGCEAPCGLCGWTRDFGSDEFRPVIERGEAYLRAHPQSPIAREVRWRVAEAHETAWSLAHAGHNGIREGEFDIDWTRYALDAPRHRDRAMALYEQLLREEPGGSRAEHARARLARMRIDVDTNYHRYWCVWD